MYSPKIREDLISRIRQTATKAGVPMTVWVNQVIERALGDGEPPQEGGTPDECEELVKSNHP